MERRLVLFILIFFASSCLRVFAFFLGCPLEELRAATMKSNRSAVGLDMW
jgi:hypothetical protein